MRVIFQTIQEEWYQIGIIKYFYAVQYIMIIILQLLDNERYIITLKKV